MYKIVQLILGASLLIYSANALDCRLCIGSIDGDCANNPDSETVIQHCLPEAEGFGVNAGDGLLRDIYCVVLETPDTPEMTGGVERGCGYIYKNEDICEYIFAHNIATSCTACDTDLCN